jgi:CBS domain containing-hemolysin-like protein
VRDLVAPDRRNRPLPFPVTRGDLDETIGIVHLKQVLGARRERDRTRLDTLAQPVPVVPSTLDGDSLMAQIPPAACRPRWSPTSTAGSPAW